MAARTRGRTPRTDRPSLRREDLAMSIATPVDDNGQIAPGWGRARQVAVATTDGDEISHWRVIRVGWDVAHDEGSEGAHHARVARFLIDHEVTTVVAEHMGPGMARMLATMGLTVLLGAHGDARAAVLSAVANTP